MRHQSPLTLSGLARVSVLQTIFAAILFETSADPPWLLINRSVLTAVPVLSPPFVTQASLSATKGISRCA